MSGVKEQGIIQFVLSLHQNGNTERAIDLVEKRLQHNDDGRLWELLGILEFAISQVEAAQASLEEASVRVPLSPRAQIVLAKCYDASGHRESAAAIYRHLSELAGLETDLLEPLAAGLGRCGECRAAMRICREAAARLPGSTAPLLGIAHYMRRLRHPVEDILPVMFQAHHLEPDNFELRISLAWMLFETGLADDAATLLEPVPCAEFNCIRCLTLMQHVFENVGNDENAELCRNRLMVLANERAAERNEYPPYDDD